MCHLRRFRLPGDARSKVMQKNNLGQIIGNHVPGLGIHRQCRVYNPLKKTSRVSFFHIIDLPNPSKSFQTLLFFISPKNCSALSTADCTEATKLAPKVQSVAAYKCHLYAIYAGLETESTRCGLQRKCLPFIYTHNNLRAPQNFK